MYELSEIKPYVLRLMTDGLTQGKAVRKGLSVHRRKKSRQNIRGLNLLLKEHFEAEDWRKEEERLGAEQAALARRDNELPEHDR